jgi:hypothetical protein
MRTLVVLLLASALVVSLKPPAFTSPLTFPFKNSILVIRNLKIVPNEKIVEVNCTVYNNEGIRTYSTDVTIKTNAVITKMWVYGLIRSQRDDHDVKFTNEFFRCVVDVEKTLESLKNNLLVTMIVDIFMSASEKKIKFPLEKVSSG